MTAVSPTAASTASERWLARLAFLSLLAALVVLVLGGLRSIGILLLGVLGLAVTLAAAWWFLSHRGIVRVLAALVAVAVPIAVIWVYIARKELLAIILVIALVAVAAACGRTALAHVRSEEPMPERSTPPPLRPYVIMNPRSGGGKVVTFDLQAKAEALGAEVGLIDGPGQIDVAAMARDAVAGGADLLGVAGGDGTQALVAGIAAEHDLPFLVISAGTRNHFAMDLGLDRDHPDGGLEAFTDGVEITVDLGVINGRTFVNNASFGAYAVIVENPDYRADKRGTTLGMLPELLSGQSGPRIVAHIDGKVTVEGAKALLISNNPYELSDPMGLGRRAHLDRGVLGAVAVTVDNAAQAAALVGGRHATGLQTYTAREVVIDADVDQIPVGIDGESIMMSTPVRCEIHPGALRIRVPRHRVEPPGPTPGRHLDLLWHLAVGGD